MKTKLIILLFGGLTLGSFSKSCGKIKSSNNNSNNEKQEQHEKAK